MSVVPALVIAAIVVVFVLSALPSTAPALPILSLVLIALAGIELMLMRYNKSSDASRWDIATAFVLVSTVAAALSEPEHIIAAAGLTMPQ